MAMTTGTALIIGINFSHITRVVHIAHQTGHITHYALHSRTMQDTVYSAHHIGHTTQHT